MKNSILGLTLLLLVSIIPQRSLAQCHGCDTIRIACVGNSITEGHGLKDKKTESYPARLQQILGSHYAVQNFGLSGHTLMMGTDRPYMNDKKWHRFQKALASQPDIVTIKLGTNDSKTPYDSLLHADFTRDLNALVDSFQALPSRPYIYLCLPIPAVGEVWTIRDSVIEQEILPRIRAVAQQRRLPVIDLYTIMKPFPELLPDKIHPGAGGAMIIAEEIARRIQLDLAKGLIHYGAEAGLNPAYSLDELPFRGQGPNPHHCNSEAGKKCPKMEFRHESKHQQQRKK